MSQKEYSKMSDSEQKKEDWMNAKWRPMMGWMYMVVCMFDFVIAPVLWSLIQAVYKGGVNVQWQPLTLQGAGLFHLAMGGVLGVAAFGRTKEKLEGANNGGAQLGTTYQPPAPIQAQPAGFGSPAPVGGFGGGFGAPAAPAAATGFSGGFGAPAAPVATNAMGKKVVPQFDQPLI